MVLHAALRIASGWRSNNQDAITKGRLLRRIELTLLSRPPTARSSILIALAEPDGAIPMIAQLITGIAMHEHRRTCCDSG